MPWRFECRYDSAFENWVERGHKNIDSRLMVPLNVETVIRKGDRYVLVTKNYAKVSGDIFKTCVE